MLKVAVVGAGMGHAGAYLAGVRKVAGADVIAVIDRDLAAAREFAAKNSVPEAHGSFESLSPGAKPDCVMVASETHKKLDYVREAVALGVPILCDKPVGRDAGEARAIASACDGARVPLMAGYCLRFAYAARRLRGLVEEGRLGTLTRARATIFRAPLGGWYADPEKSGGALMDVGSYLPDLLRYLTGAEPVAVTAVGSDDLAVMAIEFGGLLASAEMICRGPKGVRLDVLELEGAAGMAWANNISGKWFILEEDGGPIVLQDPPPGTPDFYDAMIAEFLACVAERRKPVPDARDGVIPNAVIGAAYESMKSGRRVVLDLP